MSLEAPRRHLQLVEGLVRPVSPQPEQPLNPATLSALNIAGSWQLPEGRHAIINSTVFARHGVFAKTGGGSNSDVDLLVDETLFWDMGPALALPLDTSSFFPRYLQEARGNDGSTIKLEVFPAIDHLNLRRTRKLMRRAKQYMGVSMAHIEDAAELKADTGRPKDRMHLAQYRAAS